MRSHFENNRGYTYVSDDGYFPLRLPSKQRTDKFASSSRDVGHYFERQDCRKGILEQMKRTQIDKYPQKLRVNDSFLDVKMNQKYPAKGSTNVKADISNEGDNNEQETSPNEKGAPLESTSELHSPKDRILLSWNTKCPNAM